MRRDMHQGVEYDDSFQSRTERYHPVGTIVLVLFTYEQETNLRIVDHELNLLFRTGSIERNRDGTNAPCTKVTTQILYGILREDTDILLHLHTQVQHSVADLHDSL